MMWKSKTFWTGIGTVGYGVYLITAGDTGVGVQTVLGGLGIIFLRSGIDKSKIF